MEFPKLASNLDLKFEDFLYAENIRSAQISCTALQWEGLNPLPKHRHLAPFVTLQSIWDIFTEPARQIWQQTYRKPTPIWHGKLEAPQETLRHLKWHWMPMLAQLNWDTSIPIQKLLIYLFQMLLCLYYLQCDIFKFHSTAIWLQTKIPSLHQCIFSMKSQEFRGVNNSNKYTKYWDPV